MKTFEIYAHADGHREAVKVGWSWPAFFFCHVWALFKQMWPLAAGGFALHLLFNLVAMDALPPGAADGLTTLVMILVSAAYGGYGNTWRGDHLRKQGYRLLGMVHAQTPQMAIDCEPRPIDDATRAAPL